MEIVTPPRIATLDAQPIQVIQHDSYTKKSTYTLENVYPFETLFSVKQRIALHNNNDKTWLPSQVFVATSSEDGQYEPIEFAWPFSTTILQDPLLPESVGKPDPRIWADNSRKSVFPVVLSGITVETAISDTPRTVHVWNLYTVCAAAGFGAQTLPTESVFQGFLQLYFPLIESQDILQQALRPLSDEDREIFTAAKSYREQVDKRLSSLEKAIKSETLQSARPFQLTELRFAKFRLPEKEKFNTGVLELRFYELVPSDSVPFLRYFPAKDRTAPLLKLAVSQTGISKIEDRRVLDMFLADQPDTTNGAVIVLKSPILRGGRAPLGTAWTLRIYEIGKAELEIMAPRKDAPLSTAVVVEAMSLLPTFLQNTPWKDAATPILDELQASYEFTTTRPGGKPSRAELKSRVDPFLPLFEGNIDIEEGDTAAIILRYKALSNFKHDTNPIKRFITTLFQNKKLSADDDAPIAAYAKRLGEEFGLSRAQAGAYLQDWLARDADAIEIDKKVVPLSNIGSLIKIYNSHPKYVFQVNNIESITDLSRITTLMTVFVTQTAAELHAVPAPESARAEVAMESALALEEEAPLEELDAAELAAMGIDVDTFHAPVNPVEEAQNTAPARMPEEVPRHTTTRIAPGEVIQPIDDSWYLKRLVNYDSELFNYTKKKDDPRVTVYSRTCQQERKQPHVMPPEMYERARQEYRHDVFWVEAPLSPYDLEAITTASKSVGERGKNQKTTQQAGIIELEKRALRLGFSLKENKTVAKSPADLAIIKELTDDQYFDKELRQDRKPLWTVLRLGTNTNKPNYYLCSELWCIREDLPIMERDFQSTQMRNGQPKPAKSCPFCTGNLITDKAVPKPGETVLRRPPITEGGPIARYVGFQKKLYHPDKFALPCCFVSPDDLVVPVDAMPLPDEKYPLPDIQRPADAPPVQDFVPADAAVKATTDIFRDRPFSPYRRIKARDAKKEETFIKNGYYIPNQNILGRSTEDWFELERGAVAVPPESVNVLLGQNPENFLTAIKGVKAEKINSQLKDNTHAFVRYGIGGNVRQPGGNLLSLIAFADYAIKNIYGAELTVTIDTNETVLNKMFDEKQFQMLHAFEQANYGTLVHEFSTDKIPKDTNFDTWFKTVMPGAHQDQKPYAELLYRSWFNFRDYVYDEEEPKDLRLWESLFATPGLLTSTGFILVKILYPKGKDKPAVIQCPEFGVSYANQIALKNLPLLFVLQDSVTGLYDPLVFYQGQPSKNGTKTEKTLLGVLQIDTPTFSELSKDVREPLKAFFKQYITPVHGCGREAIPVHPWVLETDQEGIPTLGDIVARIGESDMSIDGLLRDWTNRCVGIFAKWDGHHIYLPCRDDGTILPDHSSVHGGKALPRPDLESVFKMLVGAPRLEGSAKIAALFPGYQPALLVASATHYEGIQMRCGAIIPIKPHLRTTDIPHKWFVEMKKEDMLIDMPDVTQWETDMELLRPGPKEVLPQTEEEHLEEAYQHVRISFSNWLVTDTQGANVRKQIHLLREARKRLPLYELQKRLEVLLSTIILNPKTPWLTSAGDATSSVLRRDCLEQSQKNCTAGCAWNSATSKCLIHIPDGKKQDSASNTQRYINPKRVIVLRLADELLRSFGYANEILDRHVPYLKPLSADTILREGESVLLSVSGRGDASTYEKLGYTGRKPTDYTHGDTYPEEVDIEIETPGDWLQILRPTVLGADIYRNPRAMLEATLVSLSDRSIQELVSALHIDEFTGTRSDWKKLANHLKLDLLFTKVDQTVRAVVIETWLGSDVAPTTARRFVIMDPDGIPYQRIKDGSQIIPESDVPSSVKSWIDKNSPK